MPDAFAFLTPGENKRDEVLGPVTTSMDCDDAFASLASDICFPQIFCTPSNKNNSFSMMWQ